MLLIFVKRPKNNLIFKRLRIQCEISIEVKASHSTPGVVFVSNRVYARICDKRTRIKILMYIHFKKSQECPHASRFIAVNSPRKKYGGLFPRTLRTNNYPKT